MNTITARFPLPLYYAVISIGTESILAGGAVLILLPTGFLSDFPLWVLGFVLAFKTFTATVALSIVAHNRWQEHTQINKAGGWLLGRVVGLLLGGILGGRYGGAFWGIVGAVGLYLIVGRIGSKISFFIGNQLDKLTSSTGKADSESKLTLVRPNALLISIYGIVVPILFIMVAVFLKSSALPVSNYSEGLPTARIVVIILSLLALLLPWLLQTRWIMKSQASTVSRENAIFLLGIGLSVAPTIYGLLLFIAFGASIIELGIFAVVSSLAAIIWSVNTKIRQQKAG